MLEDNDFIEKLNNQSYASSTQQSSSLTVEDLQRTVNDLKEKYGDIQDRPYRPMLPSNDVVVNAFSAPMFSIPSRVHEDDVVGTVLNKQDWPYLNLPPEPSKMTHQEIEEGFAKHYEDNKPSVFSAYQGLGIVQSHVHSMMRPITVSGTDEDFNLEDHIKDTNIALQSSITVDDILHLLETLHDEASKEAPMFAVPLKNYKKIKVAYIKNQRPHGVVLRKSVLRRINKRQKQQINKVNKALKKYKASSMYNEGRQCK